MRLFRGPNTGRRWEGTDAKHPKDYMRDWEPGAPILFDGTIQKSGSRHTDIGVQLDEADVIGLQKGLINYYRKCRNEGKKFEKRVEELESALQKISRLVSSRRYQAPSMDDLLAAVEEIADHYGESWNRDERFKCSFSFVKWSTL